ncbi:MAG TPA: hypothetical protein VGJ82_17180 [Thermoanaerobaculia bacterium]
MTNERLERLNLLMEEATELSRRLQDVPHSPLPYLPLKQRWKYRRLASRLRKGRLYPKFGNLFSAEGLAAMCERAIQRDEKLEKLMAQIWPLLGEISILVEELQLAADEEAAAQLVELRRAARQLGPQSDAAARCRQLNTSRRTRKQKWREVRALRAMNAPTPGVQRDLYQRFRMMAAEHVPEPPSGEPVLSFPADDAFAGEALFLRIGVDEHQWLGRFRRGRANGNAVDLMPDQQTLLVVASGAGYLIDVKTRALVCELGDDIEVYARHEPQGLVFLDHAGSSLEAFGAEGRRWRTPRLGSGGLRNFSFVEGYLVLEVRQPDDQWIDVAINAETGEVCWNVVVVETDASATG